MSDQPIFLLHTRPDARMLSAWIARKHARSSHRPSDMGDALHGLLTKAFGDLAPKPFRYLDEDRGLLAYTHLDDRAMAAQVVLADPIAAQTLGLGASSRDGGYRLRPFPAKWPVGQTLSFEVRVRPTTRSDDGERDVFLRAVAKANGAALDRSQVYLEWFRKQVEGADQRERQPWQGGVELLDTRVDAFQRLKVVRRDQKSADDEARKTSIIEGPDVVLKGRLRVQDSEAFAQLLRRGVGRHRAFGFGMLLLSRA
ncbi:MAG: type I-E CRISPR-associated protein Cas6/Cse3/CasE [Lautropia sp.]|nr:type I-E CRISPR-associated protein Cas6/Cse3/CasE [Lautropia sp.]